MNNACVLPFSEIQILSGDVMNFCCYGDDVYPIKHKSIIETFYNDDYVNIIRTMLDMGLIPQYCAKCKSLDNPYNRHYLTKKNTTNKRLELSKITYSPSNICNLHCRTCAASNSSGYSAKIENKSGVISSELYDEICRELDSMKDGIQKYTFMGGEPLLEQKNATILDILSTSKNNDMMISFITNGTNNLDNFDMFNKLNKFKNVHFAVSVDGMPELMNHMRGGYDYTSNPNYIEDILSRTCDLPNFTSSLSITISNINMIFMYDFIKYIVDLRTKYNFYITVNYVHTPSIFMIENVSDEVISKWNNDVLPKILSIPNIQEHTDIMDKIVNSVTEIYANRVFDENLWNMFLERTKVVDELENISLYDYYFNKIRE